MTSTEVREQRIAEVRQALEALQKITAELQAAPDASSTKTQQPPIDLRFEPDGALPRDRALVTTTHIDAPRRRGRAVPIAVAAALLVAAASTGVAIRMGYIDPAALTTALFQPAPDDAAPTTAAAEPGANAPTPTPADQSPAGAAGNDGAAPAAGQPSQAAGLNRPEAETPTGASKTAAAAAATAAAATANGSNAAASTAKPAPPPAAADPQAGIAAATPAPAPGIAQPGAPAPAAIASPLDQAKTLMMEGNVLQAREVLLASAPEASHEKAWWLAKTYDPNYLGSLTRSNAEPDLIKAAHWYRIWHKSAQEAGLVSNRMSVEKLIRAMSN